MAESHGSASVSFPGASRCLWGQVFPRDEASTFFSLAGHDLGRFQAAAPGLGTGSAPSGCGQAFPGAVAGRGLRMGAGQGRRGNREMPPWPSASPLKLLSQWEESQLGAPATHLNVHSTHEE